MMVCTFHSVMFISQSYRYKGSSLCSRFWLKIILYISGLSNNSCNSLHTPLGYPSFSSDPHKCWKKMDKWLSSKKPIHLEKLLWKKENRLKLLCSSILLHFALLLFLIFCYISKVFSLVWNCFVLNKLIMFDLGVKSFSNTLLDNS